MTAVEAKPVVKMRMEGSCPTHSRTDLLVRDVDFIVDEPKERGGTNLGPSPTETMIGALVACTNVISNKIAAAAGIKIERMDIEAVAQFDRGGVTLQEEVQVPFPEIDLKITVVTDADEATFAKVRQDLPKFCAVSKVIRQAGTKINEFWTLTPPQ